MDRADGATPNQLLAVAYGSGKFVATGQQGAIVSSPDGIVWTPRSSGVSTQLSGVAQGGSRFVAVGGTAFLTSPDGASWTAGTFPGSNNSAAGVTFGDTVFVTSGSAFLASPDGVTWPYWPTGPNPIGGGIALTSGAAGFVSVGDCQTIALGR